MAAAESTRIAGWHWAIVALAALIAYGSALAGSFHFDDYALFQDPAIVDGAGLFRPEQTRPLSWLTFWANYQTSGRDPVGYLAVNLALHVACALALFAAALRFAATRTALLAALLFAVHPAASEAVCYVFARPIVLATLFCLLSLRDFVDGRGWRAALWFALALLSKEECAAFPLLLAAIEWRPEWFLLEERKPTAGGRRAIALMLLLGLLAGLHVIWAAAAIGAPAGAASGVAPFNYLSAQGSSLTLYLSRIVLPWGFSIEPDVNGMSGSRILHWLLAAAVLAGAWLLRHRGGLWIAAGFLLLLPSSSVFAVADLAAYRRMYFPMAAWAIGIALLSRALDARVQATMLIVLAALCWPAVAVWKTEQSLWTNAVQRAPRKLRPRIQLARALPAAQALEELKVAESLAAGEPRAGTSLALEQGRILLEQNRPLEALTAFGQALALDPRNARALHNRGAVLWSLGQRESALADFARAVERDPCLWEPRVYLRQADRYPPIPAQCRFTVEQLRQIQAISSP